MAGHTVISTASSESWCSRRSTVAMVERQSATARVKKGPKHFSRHTGRPTDFSFTAARSSLRITRTAPSSHFTAHGTGRQDRSRDTT